MEGNDGGNGDLLSGSEQSDTTQPFTYQPLDLSTSSIRLIQIQRSDEPDEPIRCTLRHGTTDSDYACLSYVWGTELGSHTIILSGKYLKVGRNVWEFMFAWRQKPHMEHKWLWIDSICLDQANTTERNHQVQQMGSIYSHATEVYSWLGVDPRVARHLKSPLITITGATCKSSKLPLLVPIDIAEAFRAFIGLEYWTRAWVTQEIVLAREVILLASETEHPLYTLPIWQVDEFQLLRSMSWEDITHERNSTEKDFSNFLSFHPYLTKNLGGRSLAYLLMHFRGKQCHIARDRIFSLLSLSGYSKRLKVDYSIPDAQLFATVLVSCNETFCFCSMFPLCQALSVTSQAGLEELADKMKSVAANQPFVQLRLSLPPDDFNNVHVYRPNSGVFAPSSPNGYKSRTSSSTTSPISLEVGLQVYCDLLWRQATFHVYPEASEFTMQVKP